MVDFDTLNPIINYKSITINGKSIAMSSSNAKLSFVSPYNTIVITLRPAATLSYWEARITELNAAYDIGIGYAWAARTNVSSSSDTTISLTIPEGSSTEAINERKKMFGNYADYNNKSYRIGLYAKDAATGRWDMTYLFFEAQDKQVTTSEGEDVVVSTKQSIPQNNN